MGELGIESGLIDVTQTPLAQLATLDDAVIEMSLSSLLRLWGSAGDRRWDNG